MRLIFFGTADFAVPALRAAAQAAEVTAVVCAPDAVGERGMKTVVPPLKRAAAELNLPTVQPPTPAGAIELVRSEKPDALIVAAYGRILPRALLRLPRRGALNIHPSLLPRWRGAAPIERAILAGDADTGVTIIQMDCGLDSGAILLRQKTAVAGDAGAMRAKLADLGARLIVRALLEPADPIPQSEPDATYAARIDKAEAAIRWTDSAAQIARQVRAFSPKPGAFSVLDKTRIKIFAAMPTAANPDSKPAHPPGGIADVTAEGIVVACGGEKNDALLVTCLQRPGGRIMSAAEFCRGFGVAVGRQFTAPPTPPQPPPSRRPPQLKSGLVYRPRTPPPAAPSPPNADATPMIRKFRIRR